ncbi:MAG: hypothetical protein FJ137_06680 [Deltaproteobacteria bacterium]|nr:hypothetical protein [Deltaproteobacteria bacterium]
MVLKTHPGLRDGDVHLVRAGLWTGAFDAACVAAALRGSGGDGRAAALASLSTWAIVTGAGLGAATAFDVVDAAPSLGLSSLWIKALSTGLTLAITDLPAEWPNDPSPLIAATTGAVGTASGVGGVLLGDALHLSRGSVWLDHVGAGVGALSALALATGLRAGTPAVGWGSVLSGTLAGTGAGLFAAYTLEGGHRSGRGGVVRADAAAVAHAEGYAAAARGGRGGAAALRRRPARRALRA